MKIVMKVSDNVVVLNQGNVIAEVLPETVQCNAEVIRASLGHEGRMLEIRILCCRYGKVRNIEGRSRFWERSSRAPPLGQSSI